MIHVFSIARGLNPRLLNFEKMELFYSDLSILLSQVLTINEIFYFAAMIHLVFVKIHPFAVANVIDCIEITQFATLNE